MIDCTFHPLLIKGPQFFVSRPWAPSWWCIRLNIINKVYLLDKKYNEIQKFRKPWGVGFQMYRVPISLELIKSRRKVIINPISPPVRNSNFEGSDFYFFISILFNLLALTLNLHHVPIKLHFCLALWHWLYLFIQWALFCI
jgi:hypothetical protein